MLKHFNGTQSVDKRSMATTCSLPKILHFLDRSNTILLWHAVCPLPSLSNRPLYFIDVSLKIHGKQLGVDTNEHRWGKNNRECVIQYPHLPKKRNKDPSFAFLVAFVLPSAKRSRACLFIIVLQPHSRILYIFSAVCTLLPICLCTGPKCPPCVVDCLPTVASLYLELVHQS